VGTTIELLKTNQVSEHCQAVSCEHFSTDALLSLFVLTEPDLALPLADTLIEIARAANYHLNKDRDAAHVNFVIKAWTRVATSPLKEAIFSQTPQKVALVLFEELLPRLATIIARIDHFEPFWQREEGELSYTEELLETGKIAITGDESLDLAQITAVEKAIEADDRSESTNQPGQPSPIKRLGTSQALNLHPIALHNVTSHWRVLVQVGEQKRFYYRNEVRATCHQARVGKLKNIQELADRLNAQDNSTATWQLIETNQDHWTSDPSPYGVELVAGAETSLNREKFCQIIKNFLME
jgi:hypothetical protein